VATELKSVVDVMHEHPVQEIEHLLEGKAPHLPKSGLKGENNE